MFGLNQRKKVEKINEQVMGPVEYKKDELLSFSQNLKGAPIVSSHQIEQAFSEEISNFVSSISTCSADGQIIFSESTATQLVHNLVRLIGPIPASAYHHGSGAFGLFRHSLAVGSLCAQYAKNIRDEGATYEQNFNNRSAKKAAGGILGLYHDIGKVFDVSIVDEQNRHWEPQLFPLEDWTKQNNSQKLVLDWKKNRNHKGHEKRAFALFLEYFLTPDLAAFFEFYEAQGLPLLDWIREALEEQKGPFAEILKASDRNVTAKEMRNQCITLPGECIEGTFSTQAQFVIQALRNLQLKEKLTINLSDSYIYLTRSGPLLLIDEKLVDLVRCELVESNYTEVPSTVDGFIDCLITAKIITQLGWEQSDPESYVLSVHIEIEENNIRKVKAVRFNRWDTLYPWETLPPRLNSWLCEDSPCLVNIPQPLPRHTPVLDFRAKGQKPEKKATSSEVSPANKAKKICSDALKLILSNGAQTSEISSSCIRSYPSTELENFLSERGVSLHTFEAYLAASEFKEKIKFEPADHRLSIQEIENEEPKPIPLA